MNDRRCNNVILCIIVILLKDTVTLDMHAKKFLNVTIIALCGYEIVVIV